MVEDSGHAAMGDTQQGGNLISGVTVTLVAHDHCSFSLRSIPAVPGSESVGEGCSCPSHPSDLPDSEIVAAICQKRNNAVFVMLARQIRW